MNRDREFQGYTSGQLVYLFLQATAPLQPTEENYMPICWPIGYLEML